MIDPHVSAGPHKFRPLKWWDVLSRTGRCRHCYCRRDMHPIHCWVPSRPASDTDKVSTWRALYGDQL